MHRSSSSHQGSKILIYAGTFPPRLGGYEIHLHEMLSRLAERGFLMTVITPTLTATREAEYRNHIRILSLRALGPPIGGIMFPLPTPGNIRIVIRELREDYQFVWTHTRFFPTTLLGAAHARLRNIRLVHTEHGGEHHAFRSWPLRLLGRLFDHTIGRLVLSNAACVIAVSDSTAGFIKHISPTSNPQVILNGRPLKMPASFCREDVRREFGLRDVDVVVSSAGRIEHSKGVVELADAVRDLRHEGFDHLRLILIGDGSLANDIEATLGSDGVIITGQMAHDEALRIMGASDIYVSASHHEGYGLSTIEAASCGMPIIATLSGGITNHMRNGEDGFLFSIGDTAGLKDHIRTMLEHPDLRNRLGRNARTFASKWPTWDDAADEMSTALRSLRSSSSKSW